MNINRYLWSLASRVGFHELLQFCPFGSVLERVVNLAVGLLHLFTDLVVLLQSLCKKMSLANLASDEQGNIITRLFQEIGRAHG